MSKQEIADLVSLDPSRFDEREHLALSWVRATLTERKGAPAQLEDSFVKAFDAREQAQIKATMLGMFFSNLTSNTFFGWMARTRGGEAREPAPACGI